MIVNSSKNDLSEYVGYANCIEYNIKSYHKYLTIPVKTKIKGMKRIVMFGANFNLVPRVGLW